VAIDLMEVILVDREAVRVLALSEANGIWLRNYPIYIREWIARENSFWCGTLGPEDRRGT
jgi:hypothetical protein